MDDAYYVAEYDVAEVMAAILKLNPIYYIVSGYRDCLINKIPFWQHNTCTICFWLVTATLFLVGIRLFSKLKVHFADVL